MTFVEIHNPSSISSSTSYLTEDEHWIIHDFTYDKSTKAFIVSNQGRQEIALDNAVHLIKNGIFRGIAINPKAIVSPEFSNIKEVSFTGGILIGMALLFGGLTLIGKD